MSRYSTQLFRSSSRIAGAMFLALTFAACNDSSTEPARTAATVVVAPAQRTLSIGGQAQYTAQVLDGSGNELTGRAVAWSSADVAIATVNGTGLVTAVGAGTTSIRATVDGKIGTGALTVSPAPVATLAMDAAQVALVQGDTRVLVATAKDAQGNVLAGRAAAWESTNPQVATVSTTGLVTAVGVGNADVRATVEGKVAVAAISVSAIPVASVEPSETAVSIEQNASRDVTAVARDAQGRVLLGRTFTWTTDDASIATVSTAGRITGVALGRTNIRVTSENRAAVVTVTITAVRAASVSIAPANIAIEIGETQQLQAIVRDAAGNVLTNRAVTWATSNATASVSNTGVLLGKRSGPITITATVDGVSAIVNTAVQTGPQYAWDLLYHRAIPGAQEIFTLELGTSMAPVRINAGTVSRSPSASPDGQRIVFAVSQIDIGTGKDIYDLFAVDRNGLNVKQITTMTGVEDVPSWSPDGSRIAFVHYPDQGRADIWTMRPDGTDLVKLTGDMANGVNPGMPAWSPDGSRIAFVESVSGAQGTLAKIWTMRADGTDKREITSTVTGFDASPTWSSDGQRIAFMRYFGAEPDIAIVPANGGVVTRIQIAGMQSSPSWSPDGTYIAFHQNDGPLSNIYTMRPDGTGIRLRTVDAAWNGGLAPRWIRKN